MVQQKRPAPNAGSGGRQGNQGSARTAKGKKQHSGLVSGIKKKVKKGVKKGVHAAKVGRAAVRLAGKLTNPVNQAKMVANAVRGKGIVLPGSNYIGPGNPMGRKVKSKSDALAKKHDEDYDRYLKAGYSKKKIYAGFSDADKRLMKKSDTTKSAGLATYLGMKGKHLLNKAGLTGKKTTDVNMKKREAAQKAASGTIKSAMIQAKES